MAGLLDQLWNTHSAKKKKKKKKKKKEKKKKKKKKKKISKKKKHYKYVKYIQVSNKNPKTVSGASAVKFEHILHFILILLWLNLNQKMLAGFEKL